jgi:hypothetical protein
MGFLGKLQETVLSNVLCTVALVPHVYHRFRWNLTAGLTRDYLLHVGHRYRDTAADHSERS